MRERMGQAVKGAQAHFPVHTAPGLRGQPSLLHIGKTESIFLVKLQPS